MKSFKATFRNAVLLTMIFLLASQPVLVAAQPQRVDPHAEAVNLALEGGDRYLESASHALVESAELLGYLEVIQNTPVDQISEAYIEETIDRALNVAEETSTALGAVDDLADGIEQLGGVLPGSMDVASAIGVPEEMRNDLIALGIPSAQVDAISAGASTIYTSRQGGISPEIQQSLLDYGFTQSQINEIAQAVTQRGLVNPNLDTRMGQFRATQDELADTRSGMLTLAVQLLGYQIAIRQMNGLEPREATTAELQELAEDEMRLLVHAAHINAMWGSNPDNETGEGDWWFIEHYAGRSAERLQRLIVETQNRGLVAELFIIQQMKMLAVSARTGDAEYAKAELDALAVLLAHRLNTTAYYEERLTAGVLEQVWSRLITTDLLRGIVEWNVPNSVAKNAVLVSQYNMDETGVENLALLVGQFEEPNETNNINGLLIVAGLSFFDQINVSVNQVIQILATATPEQYLEWIKAILTGDTDNPALLGANVILSLIPVIGVIPDLATLAVDPSIFVKALSLIGIIGSIGDILALIPGLQGVGGASFVGDAVAAVVKGLFKAADGPFRAVLNGLKLADAFDVVVDLTKTVVNIVGSSLGNGLQAVINTISNIFSGTRSLWGDFVAFVRRVGSGLLLRLGFDEGSALVGRILRQGVTLSDEALITLKNVSDDLVEAGVDLTDNAAKGLGNSANIFPKGEFEDFINALKNCSVSVAPNSSYKLAAPTRGVPICDTQKFKAALELMDDTPALRNFVAKVKGVDVGEILKRFQSEPEKFQKIVVALGPNASRDVINSALSAGRRAGVGGPDAVYALSFWDRGLLKNHPSIAKELAERSGMDAIAIKILTDWNGNISTLDIDGIAKNSTFGNYNLFGLGPGVPNESPYLVGWVKFSRENKAKYYLTNDGVGELIRQKIPNEAQRNEVFWAINKAALDRAGGPISKKNKFIYQIDENLSSNHDDVIRAIWGGVSDADILREYFPTRTTVPFSVKELRLLYGNGYNFMVDSVTGNVILTP